MREAMLQSRMVSMLTERRDSFRRAHRVLHKNREVEIPDSRVVRADVNITKQLITLRAGGGARRDIAV
jgi:hypothetical protein